MLSIILLVLHQRSPRFQSFVSKLSVIVLPIQMIVDTPIKITHWLGTRITAQRTLLANNANLRLHNLLLKSQLQRLKALEKENTQLKQLLQSSSSINGKVLLAGILTVGLDPAFQQVILDKGLSSQVFAGQPVLDSYGIFGQVIHVGLLTSKVMLISDIHSAVPVEDYRNGIRAIAAGTGNDHHLVLIDVPNTSDIRIGDAFVASGLAARFPAGYPVGKVVNVKRLPGARFLQVSLDPAAHLDRTEQVLLVWPETVKLQKAAMMEIKQ